MNCGLGNNGGSLTIIKSANTLVDLGHDVTIVDTGKYCNTWVPLKAKFKKVKSVQNIPAAEAIIATGYGTVKTTVDAPDKCGLKMHWIRGWETWNMSEDKIKKKVLDQPTLKMVNSTCLQKKLQEFGKNAYIIRPGYDFNEIFPTYERTDREIVLGGLYNTGVKRAGKRVSWIFETAKKMKELFPGTLLLTFGSDGTPNMKHVDVFAKDPTIEQKNKMYNQVNIWLSPTELEGLHIPPAEAMLTCCPVVGTNAPMSGMQDYLISGKTGLVSENNLKSFIDTVEFLMEQPGKRKRMGNRARDMILTLGSREDNMKRLVDLIGSF